MQYSCMRIKAKLKFDSTIYIITMTTNSHLKHPAQDQYTIGKAGKKS